MRSKAPLALMEQAIMVLVFALAAALCLRVFVWSDGTSKAGEARDRAAVLAQTAAETVKHEGEKGGDMASVLTAAAEELGVRNVQEGADPVLTAPYNEDWSPADSRESAAYILQVRPLESDTPGLMKAAVRVRDAGEETPLFEIEVAWQTEVAE